MKRSIVTSVFCVVAMIATSVSFAQSGRAPRAGERRIVNGRCLEYKMVQYDMQGHRVGRWSPFNMGRPVSAEEFARQCANATNIREYLDTRPVETLDSADNLTAAIREGRAQFMNGRFRNGRAHACGRDGFVYDVFSDGSSARHQQTLAYPNKRCRIGTVQQYYHSSVPATIPSIGGL